MEGAVLQLLSLLGLVAFSVVGGIVGLRIRKLAKATGGAPERWVALCLIAICGVAYPLLIVSQLAPAGAVRVALLSLGVGVAHVGIAAMFLFTWSAFRAGVAWIRWPIAAACAVMAAHWLGVTGILWNARESAGSLADMSPIWSLVPSLVSSVGFAWSGLEALHYWTLLRRRRALGLADALVVNRVFLWGLVGLSSTIINTNNILAIVRGVNTMADPGTALVTAVMGCFNAGALFLAFLPPAGYARWVRGGAEAPAA
jgi:hypothetical protein